ncbi:glycoside hydrolase family 30 protein [Flagellimonas aequoris]|uniref:Glucosylceramidase n=1 Tax=Flagellimonas aequoris TaxID=2306997 RepID=A0A418N2T4_9FLAO|nr:glycoside hydrolase family 30 beta sandwich domain-containing protein [Allomuricauda aequoris]RIV67638.1 glucosylceramidase [Allomuricauda aequoris]TXJ99463.1 glucosylceramidase [Allomuricauda aequoris]
MNTKNILIAASFAIGLLLVHCSSSTDDGGSDSPTPNPPNTGTPPTVSESVDVWLTKPDKSVLLTKQANALPFGTNPNNYPNIEVNPSLTYQTIDGFGFTLTGGSAEVINQLSTGDRNELLQELFGTSENDISISYVRVSIGASDLNAGPFTYDDMPDGETDESLDNFSLDQDREGVITVLKEILEISPNIKILGSPWSAPVWMKDNGSFVGGSLKPEYYGVYAQYFVKYIQAMEAEGITIDAITIQNEPMHDGNNPSMVMTAEEQAEFIKNHLGPAFEEANISTKIIVWDHNCDNPQYPITVLSDPDAYPYVDGSAFHLYNGDISALSTVHNSFPEKNLYFTEQYTSSNGSFDGDLKWHVKNVIIGSMRNWSRNALEWNLANDESFGPHTDGGCSICKGGLTISSGGNITRNVGYYIVAHASKFVPQGSTRISSNISGNLQNVAFKTPDDNIVLLVENDGDALESFNIKYKNEWTSTSLSPGAVATYIWKQ